ncbi:putative periplasmic protein [Marinobacterium lacunae]|uniref:Putative periplasmic protein n=1 Tax=Marinobacterium lacunae TaxID=1232683 RepID=A0A081G1X2_9GAMM|nr:hypothetical protein [Marinobacterium lacunae]KEA64777.1 putative periplasmic protein [Marinobacterium lacunae]MBR9884720.1 hypothetical protein [Oceanospirillales bacterium]
MFTRSLRRLLLPLALLVPLGAWAETDPDTGFVIAPGWETVKNNCTACHSSKLVTQNAGSRNRWQYVIRWMQETQGLWQFPAETEKTILDYLTEHYGPKEGARRPPLPPSMMPKNPYKQSSG